MEDDFSDHKVVLTSPAVAAEVVAPSDSNDLGFVSRGLYVGSQGNIALTMQEGQSIVLSNVQPGVIYPLRVMRVRATGTTATGIVALR